MEVFNTSEYSSKFPDQVNIYFKNNIYPLSREAGMLLSGNWWVEKAFSLVISDVSSVRKITKGSESQGHHVSVSTAHVNEE